MRKNPGNKSISLLTAIMIILTAVIFSGCGEKTPVSGKWETTVDFIDYIDNLNSIEALQDLPTEDMMTLFDNISIKAEMEFTNYGKCKINVDGDSIKKASDTLYNNSKTVLPEIISKQLGIDASEVEDYFASMGINIEDALDNYLGSLGISSVTDSFKTYETKYKYNNGKIYFGENEEENYEDYATVEITDGTMVISDIVSADSNVGIGFLKYFTPITFTKS